MKKSPRRLLQRGGKQPHPGHWKIPRSCRRLNLGSAPAVAPGYPVAHELSRVLDGSISFEHGDPEPDTDQQNYESCGEYRGAHPVAPPSFHTLSFARSRVAGCQLALGSASRPGHEGCGRTRLHFEHENKLQDRARVRGKHRAFFAFIDSAPGLPGNSFNTRSALRRLRRKAHLGTQ